MIDGYSFIKYQNTPNHPNDLFHHHLTAIDTWIDKQLEVPINQNFRPSLLESGGVSHRFDLENRAQTLFNILKDDEHEAQLSSDAIFLSILVGQAGNDLSLPWDHTNDPAYYTLLKEFLIDPARAGPHFFNDEKFAGLTENVLRSVIKK
jgi:hypothetical protein